MTLVFPFTDKCRPYLKSVVDAPPTAGSCCHDFAPQPQPGENKQVLQQNEGLLLIWTHERWTCPSRCRHWTSDCGLFQTELCRSCSGTECQNHPDGGDRINSLFSDVITWRQRGTKTILPLSKSCWCYWSSLGPCEVLFFLQNACHQLFPHPVLPVATSTTWVKSKQIWAHLHSVTAV